MAEQLVDGTPRKKRRKIEDPETPSDNTVDQCTGQSRVSQSQVSCIFVVRSVGTFGTLRTQIPSHFHGFKKVHDPG